MVFPEVVWPLSSTITAASIAFLFEVIFGTIVAAEAAKIIGDTILEARVNSGKPIIVGKRMGLGRIIYLVLAALAAAVTGLAVAGVQEVKDGSVIWARHLENEHLSMKEAGNIGPTVSFQELRDKGMAQLSEERTICVIEHGTVYVKDEGGGVGKQVYRSKGIEAHRCIAADEYDGSDWLAHKIQTMLHSVDGGPEAHCHEINESNEYKTIEELTWSGVLGGIAATDKLYCFKKGEYTVTRRENGRVVEKYMHIGKGSTYKKTFITKHNPPIGYVFEFAQNGMNDVCEKIAAEERFIAEGTNEWMSIFPDDSHPVKVTEGTSTVINLLFLIPAALMVILVVVLLVLKTVRGSKLKLSQDYWVVKLMIDHYEKLGNCANPDQMRDVAITDANYQVQHLGVVGGTTPVLRNKELPLQ